MDERVAALAVRQHGLVSLAQVREIGLTPAAVQHRLRCGRWQLVRFTWTQVTRRPRDVVDILLRSGVIPHRPGDVGRRRSAM